MSAILVKMPPAMCRRRRAERLSDGEADETRPGQLARHKEQNTEHDEEFDGNQRHADRHASLQRDAVAGVTLSSERGEGCTRVGIRVHADAEPRHAVRAGDAQHAKGENDAYAVRAPCA